MYVHCHCRQQVWILTLLLSRGLHLECKTRELNRGKIHKTQTIHCTNTTMVLKKKSALSVIIEHFWALKVIAKFGVSDCSKFCAASCHCVAPCPCSEFGPSTLRGPHFFQVWEPQTSEHPPFQTPCSGPGLKWSGPKRFGLNRSPGLKRFWPKVALAQTG